MKLVVIVLILFLNAVVVSGVNAENLPSARPLTMVHPDVRQSDISRNVLRAIFGMRLRKWPDGTPIKVFVLKDDAPFHIAFSKGVLHVFPHQLRRAWDRLVYSGTGQSPFEVASAAEMREKIRTVPGAIGYLPPSNKDKHINVLQVR